MVTSSASSKKKDGRMTQGGEGGGKQQDRPKDRFDKRETNRQGKRIIDERMSKENK